MKKSIIEKIEHGILTERMDTNSTEYKDFKLLIKSKVLNTKKPDRIKISLLALNFQIEDYLESSQKTKKVGAFIKDFLEAVEIRQVDFSNYIEIRPSNLSKLLNGERRLSLEMALILEKLSYINAELWLRIQYTNELRAMKKDSKAELSRYKLKQLISK